MVDKYKKSTDSTNKKNLNVDLGGEVDVVEDDIIDKVNNKLEVVNSNSSTTNNVQNLDNVDTKGNVVSKTESRNEVSQAEQVKNNSTVDGKSGTYEEIVDNEVDSQNIVANVEKKNKKKAEKLEKI